MGILALVAGAMALSKSQSILAIVGGILFLIAGCIGIPRLRWWVTFRRLSNVSFFDRALSRILFFILVIVAAVLVTGPT